MKPKYGVKVEEASQRLGIPAASVRILMRRGKLPIGIAEQLTGTRYTYYISEEMLNHYINNITGGQGCGSSKVPDIGGA